MESSVFVVADTFNMSKKKAIIAATWSFFFPPVGLILGLIAMRESNTIENRAIAVAAVVNSLISLVIWTVIALGLWWFFASGSFDALMASLNSGSF